MLKTIKAFFLKWFWQPFRKAWLEDRDVLMKFAATTLFTAGFSLLALSVEVSQWGVSQAEAYFYQAPGAIGLNFFINWKFTWKGQPALGQSLFRWIIVQILLIPLGFELYRLFIGLGLEFRSAKLLAGFILFFPGYGAAYFWAFVVRRNSNRKTIKA